MAPRRAASPVKPRRVTRARAADPETVMPVEEPAKRKTSATVAKQTATRTKAGQSTSTATSVKPATTRTRATPATSKATSAVPTTTRAKAIEAKSRVGKKTESNASRPTRAGRSTTIISNVDAALESIESNDEDDEIVIAETEPSTKASRTTRTTTSAPGKAGKSALAAAPRRRVKITPLDAPGPPTEPEPAVENKASTKPRKATSTATKSTATRSKRGAAAAHLDEEAEAGVAEKTQPDPTQRSRGRGRKAAVPKQDEVTVNSSATGAKPRGRPKKEVAIAGPVEEKPKAVVPSTRQTRTRAGSATSSVLPEATVNVLVPARKKVTFQDPPSDEDEKENKRPPALSKARSAKKPPTAVLPKKNEAAGKGMRAKPIRNPAATKSTKATRVGSTKASLRSVNNVEPEEPEKVLPRILTPKKITQVAKAAPLDSDTDEEDELAGAKTPVRDLSQSPKRGIITTMPRSASPIKKLDFTSALNALSPEKNSTSQPEGIMSPPRRWPTSPNKDVLKESPRRAPEGITVFRAHIQDSSSSASVASPPSNIQPLLNQSPKRGLSDKIIFPPSAVMSQHSPLKTALMSSPARRRFSPSKQKTLARFSPSPKKKSPMGDIIPGSAGQDKSPGDVDLVMSSHFRSSVSPQRLARVYRLNEDEWAREANEDLDFDQSVLNVRSPLKVDKVEPTVTDSAIPMALEPSGYGEDDETYNLEEEEDNLAQASCSPTQDNSKQRPGPNPEEDETMIDPTLDSEGDEDEDTTDALQDAAGTISIPKIANDVQASHSAIKRPRISNALFTRMRNGGDESEDELVADETPANRLPRSNFRPSLTGAKIRSRLSAGNAPSTAARNLGFTPLAAQVRGWQASSPEKRAALEESKSTTESPFSPLARMHVEGSVELNRQVTPLRQARKRKSLASRLSFAPSMAGSPASPDFFAESMEAKDFEEQVENQEEVVGDNDEDLHGLVQPDVLAPQAPVDTEDDGDDQSEEDTGSVDQEPGQLTTDLINFTNASDTAMVDFEALANEAETLAGHDEDLDQQPANDIDQAVSDSAPGLQTVDEEQSVLSTSSDVYGDENMVPVRGLVAEVVAELDPKAERSDWTTEMDALSAPPSVEDKIDADRESHLLQAQAVDTGAQLDASFVPTPAADVSASLGMTPSAPASRQDHVLDATEGMDFEVTPIRPDPSLPRYVHTVSKVPLRPEGQTPATLSPLKAQRKRPRSLSTSNSLSSVSFIGKRRSLGEQSLDLASAAGHLATPRANQEMTSSPQRRIRSAAPSPAHSLASQLSTPGQMSFAIEDFGDSTLDGIELPSDELTPDDAETSYVAEQEQNASIMTIGSALFKTPTVPSQRGSLPGSSAATPHYAMSTKSNQSRSNTPAKAIPAPSRMTPSIVKTPASVPKGKTPTTLLKSKAAAKTPQASRTPLKPVGSGILHGAIVHYDIHTTEGMDASGLFVELLTAMGARCVKEWKWNPRANAAAVEQNEDASDAGAGITHVVYKDGGKRTLEKVRSAKGRVLCVGVGWVLDCYREGKWLDESAYSVDSSILPRGGSRRRKSMEPRMLINENGLVSSTREHRRLTWGDHLRMTEAMKMDLINTPVRGRESLDSVESGQGHDETGVEVDEQEHDGEETDLSLTSTYDDYRSPAAATVGEDGQTANVGTLLSASSFGHEAQEVDDYDDESSLTDHTPLPLSLGASGKKITAGSGGGRPSTPRSTSLTVDYDPRTAATPLTPYLLAKGKGEGTGEGNLVPMSAPPKQLNKGIFDRDDAYGDRGLERGSGSGNNGRKFHVRMNGKPGGNSARRKTLATGLFGVKHQPVVASPLRKE